MYENKNANLFGGKKGHIVESGNNRGSGEFIIQVNGLDKDKFQINEKEPGHPISPNNHNPPLPENNPQSLSASAHNEQGFANGHVIFYIMLYI